MTLRGGEDQNMVPVFGEVGAHNHKPPQPRVTNISTNFGFRVAVPPWTAQQRDRAHWGLEGNQGFYSSLGRGLAMVIPNFCHTDENPSAVRDQSGYFGHDLSSAGFIADAKGFCGRLNSGVVTAYGEVNDHYGLPTGSVATVFTVNYDSIIGNLSNEWVPSHRVESRVATLSYRIVALKEALNDFWARLKGPKETPPEASAQFHVSGRLVFDQEVAHFTLANPLRQSVVDDEHSDCFFDHDDLHIYLAGLNDGWGPAISFVANVISKAQDLLRGMSSRVTLLRIGLRAKCVPLIEPASAERTNVRRKFYCIHGFHPPDLETPAQLLSPLAAGYVPGLLPV